MDVSVVNRTFIVSDVSKNAFRPQCGIETYEVQSCIRPVSVYGGIARGILERIKVPYVVQTISEASTVLLNGTITGSLGEVNQ